ncbi:PepSY domain-containing protein [Mycobacterium kansasii]
MNRKTKISVGIAAGAVALAAGLGVAAADGDETPVTGPAADHARTAAAQAVPGGKAGEVDQETNEGAAFYGVKVTKPDGTVVEVHLDRNFRVLGTLPVGPGDDDD